MPRQACEAEDIAGMIGGFLTDHAQDKGEWRFGAYNLCKKGEGKLGMQAVRKAMKLIL